MTGCGCFAAWREHAYDSCSRVLVCVSCLGGGVSTLAQQLLAGVLLGAAAACRLLPVPKDPSHLEADFQCMPCLLPDKRVALAAQAAALAVACDDPRDLGVLEHFCADLPRERAV